MNISAPSTAGLTMRHTSLSYLDGPINPPEVYAHEPTEAELTQRAEEVAQYWKGQQDIPRHRDGLVNILTDHRCEDLFTAYFAKDHCELGRVLSLYIGDGLYERAYTYAEQEAEGQLTPGDERVRFF